MNNDRNFYLTLVSNKSIEFYPNNNSSEFSIQLPRTINLDGEWVVGLCNINIPIGFLHIYPQDGCIELNGVTTLISHGVYQNTEIIIDALNRDKILNKHFEFKFIPQTRYTTIKKICGEICTSHLIRITKKLSDILGFNHVDYGFLFSKNILTRHSDKPASLLRALPNLLYIYCDICSPYIISDKNKQVLRIVPFDSSEYKYVGNYNVNFQPYYLPVIHQYFQTISCVIKDSNENLILFGNEPLTLTVHFQKID